MTDAQKLALLDETLRALEKATRDVSHLWPCVKATLLFHQGGAWGADQAAEWERITGTKEATTRNLCDFLRAQLKKCIENAKHSEAA